MATPIVMVTALGGDANRRKGFRVGANAYVTKPYDADELYEAIGMARAWKRNLERGRLRGEIHVELNSAAAFLQEVTHLLRPTPPALPPARSPTSGRGSWGWG